ncbi:MAG: hypothetical protein JW753_04830 [Dehalococcoidia bacterium]|nr:hypothetical protein [Dehalococcoidia bacterium]
MMRRLILAIVLVAIAFASMAAGCRSENASNADVSIVGKWKLVASSGGITGRGRIPFPDLTVEFTKDGKATWYQDGEPMWASSYSTSIEKTILSVDPVPIVKMSDGFVYAYSFPDNDTLLLTENAYDGFSDKYQRV